jgi:hypothetical protein
LRLRSDAVLVVELRGSTLQLKTDTNVYIRRPVLTLKREEERRDTHIQLALAAAAEVCSTKFKAAVEV